MVESRSSSKSESSSTRASNHHIVSIPSDNMDNLFAENDDEIMS